MLNSDSIKDMLGDTVMPQPIVRLILAFRRWLWLAVVLGLIVLACSIITNIGFYLFQIGQDLPQHATPLPATLPFTIVHPRQLLYSTEPHSVTLASKPEAAQPFTVRLRAVDGVLITPGQTLVFTFTTDVHQAYQFQLSNDLAVDERATLTFSHTVPGIDPVTVNMAKESYLASLWRNLFVIRSFSDGIIPVLIPVLLLILSSIIQKEQNRSRVMVDEFRAKLASMESDAALAVDFARLKDRLNYLPLAESQVVHDFRRLNPQQHLNRAIEDAKAIEARPWRNAHLSRAIASNDKQVAQRLHKMDQDHDIQLTEEQRRWIRHIIHLIDTRPTIALDAYTAGRSEFEPRAEQAEHDDMKNFSVAALPLAHQPEALWSALTVGQPIAIYGEAGSGKTALLLQLMHASQEAEQAIPFPLHIQIKQETSDPQELLPIIGKTMVEQVLICLSQNIEYWIYLPTKLQQELLSLSHLWKTQAHLDALKKCLRGDHKAETHFEDVYEGIQQNLVALKRTPLQQRLDWATSLIRELNFDKLLLCLDDASQAINPVRLSQGLRQLQLPILLAVAYRAGIAAPTPDPKSPVYVVALQWTPEQLAQVLDHRTSTASKGSPFDEAVKQRLLNEVHTPREFWPWWCALNALRDGDSDIGLEDWEQIAPYMEAARHERDAGLSSPWIMDDCVAALAKRSA